MAEEKKPKRGKAARRAFEAVRLQQEKKDHEKKQKDYLVRRANSARQQCRGIIDTFELILKAMRKKYREYGKRDTFIPLVDLMEKELAEGQEMLRKAIIDARSEATGHRIAVVDERQSGRSESS